MKKILFVALALIVSQQVTAQFDQGRILAGGSVGFGTNTFKSKSGSTTVTHGTSTYFSVAPNVGYFVIDKLAVGAGVGLSVDSYNSKSATGSDDKDTGITFTPFVRYYLDPGIFFQGSFGIGTHKSKTTTGNVTTESDYSSTSWALGAGYAYFLNDNVAVEPFLGYRASASHFDNDSQSMNGGLFLNVGLQVYLGARN